MNSEEILRWYLDAGVDVAVGETAADRTVVPVPAPALSPESSLSPSLSPSGPPADSRPSASGGGAAVVAQSAHTVEELRLALDAFEGCALKATATRLVFADGNPGARLMIVGEAPGAEEDRQGLPFVGVSGRLLDRMLASIGLDRESAYITNVLPWRPPGNRKPTPGEVAVCMPFLERHIELVDPAVLLLLGGLAASTLFARTEGISRLRGQWRSHASPGLPRPVDAIATFHPAYLLRSPAHKRLAWRDLLEVRRRLEPGPDGRKGA